MFKAASVKDLTGYSSTTEPGLPDWSSLSGSNMVYDYNSDPDIGDGMQYHDIAAFSATSIEGSSQKYLAGLSKDQVQVLTVEGAAESSVWM